MLRIDTGDAHTDPLPLLETLERLVEVPLDFGCVCLFAACRNRRCRCTASESQLLVLAVLAVAHRGLYACRDVAPWSRIQRLLLDPLDVGIRVGID